MSSAMMVVKAWLCRELGVVEGLGTFHRVAEQLEAGIARIAVKVP
jgi:hypothetical protein